MSGPMSMEAMVGTTLHLERGDYTEVRAAADGGLLVELTEAGDRRLVDQHARRAGALEETADQRAAWLRSLSTEELVALAASPLGGPAPDVVAEGARRMQEAAARMQPALEALRSLGLVGGAR
ncbi:hypothetical protein [Streptomyces sp. SAI-127]|uniref:hypothetical protein n=1 Tax=Streptomyces sp. SAI-127 TaxID=2940543 RepID=UPI0024764929|nr:hypothetical protein [Streptomyces sp. SAI-127]MDH6489689.1 hypothetical protein [Streptomyces sp. SAI-127]